MTDSRFPDGHVLEVDLTNEELSPYEVPKTRAGQVLGGRELGLRLLQEEQPSECFPFDENSVLVFAVDTSAETNSSDDARHWVGGVSPRTGDPGGSWVEGRFGTSLTRAGYAGIVVRGRADALTTLVVEDGTARLAKTTHLWGAKVDECERVLTADGGVCACVGPAGENFVKIAEIVHDGDCPTEGDGLGAVMGAKRLKAIVVDGGVPVSDNQSGHGTVWSFPEATPETAAEMRRRCRQYGLDAGRVEAAVTVTIDSLEAYDWSDGNTLLELLERIAYMDGIGEVLGDGVESVHRHLGSDTTGSESGAIPSPRTDGGAERRD
ncbi:Aldehyde:ferredoxin oxidoreductase [Halalkaliarchaeum sp. AArc-CO]|uniref:aldehyde ferredoxin oxidoreductase N-terminal domain-containing protein n=1 Tax=unclassified Halalkaliarchaeum TaxID=2678344 RepID=UPI00217CC6CF|nr:MULTISPECIES: aldehyde ferredoxin oxidoreductase N-terminal domain-containing protein [unclassified Halalkaliarchaeum]MDR5672086.1 aldehyde ferredoxin oxidoreductase N-terminal domain-containing protein [Halalkaliarchaeum sp. AArc-GB]UWG51584.1 Aldehyde:ferredoxin oxidoreductase [Halalkaliarchaeum sp. AArc-CO]